MKTTYAQIYLTIKNVARVFVNGKRYEAAADGANDEVIKDVCKKINHMDAEVDYNYAFTTIIQGCR